MSLFARRPLLVLCAAFLGAAVGGWFLFFEGVVPGVSASILLAVAVGACLAVGLAVAAVSFRRHRARAAVAVVASLLAVTALGQSFILFAGQEASALRAKENTTVTVTGVVTDRRGAGGYLSSFVLDVESVDGVRVNRRAVLTCHYMADLRPGMKVTVAATLTSLDEAAGEGYDASALVGDGLLLSLLSESEAELTVSEEKVASLRVAVGALRRELVARLDLETDGAYGLPSALLLGDRSALDGAVRRDFARVGVSHLLAISGLHMTLLFGFLEVLLRLCRVGKRARAVTLRVLALGYLSLLGFPPSATRAVVMLGVTYLAALLSARSDALTSLGLAGALIVAVSPSSVADAGFWMSLLATLGILTVLPLIGAKRKRGRVTSLLVRVACALAVGVVAMSFTLLVTAAAIGEIGVLSPLLTPVLTPLCGLVILGSLILLPLCGTVAGEAVAALVETVCGWMVELCAALADPAWVVVSLRHPAVLWVAVGMLIALLVLLAVKLPVRRRWVVMLPVLVGWAAVGGVLAVDAHEAAGRVEVTYLQPSSRADALVLVSGREAVICDMGNGSLSSLRASALEAARRGATEVAVLQLTHYHTATAGALGELLAEETVRALWLPEPGDAEDYFSLLACLEKAERAGVPVRMYAAGEALTVFGDGVLTLEVAALARSVQPVLLLTLEVPSAGGVRRVVYAGAGVFESALSPRAVEAIAGAEAVILGNHGPKTKVPFGEGLSFLPEAVVILPAEGDVAGWFVPPAEVPMWYGQRRFSLGRA